MDSYSKTFLAKLSRKHREKDFELTTEEEEALIYMRRNGHRSDELYYEKKEKLAVRMYGKKFSSTAYLCRAIDFYFEEFLGAKLGESLVSLRGGWLEQLNKKRFDLMG